MQNYNNFTFYDYNFCIKFFYETVYKNVKKNIYFEVGSNFMNSVHIKIIRLSLLIFFY